ncbi:hypothetical protein LINGRAHAP2_LOCUS17946 [Linum grandiflorum]
MMYSANRYFYCGVFRLMTGNVKISSSDAVNQAKNSRDKLEFLLPSKGSVPQVFDMRQRPPRIVIHEPEDVDDYMELHSSTLHRQTWELRGNFTRSLKLVRLWRSPKTNEKERLTLNMDKPIQKKVHGKGITICYEEKKTTG